MENHSLTTKPIQATNLTEPEEKHNLHGCQSWIDSDSSFHGPSCTSFVCCQLEGMFTGRYSICSLFRGLVFCFCWRSHPFTGQVVPVLLAANWSGADFFLVQLPSGWEGPSLFTAIGASVPMPIPVVSWGVGVTFEAQTTCAQRSLCGYG